MSLPDDKWLLAYLIVSGVWMIASGIAITIAFKQIQMLGHWVIHRSEIRDVEIRRLQDKVDELENHLFGE